MSATTEQQNGAAPPSEPQQPVEIPAYLQTLLAEIADREGFKNYEINARPGSNIGDGFQSLMLSVVISGTRHSADQIDNDAELVLVCKMPPASDLRRQMAVPSFQQEIQTYDHLLPELAQFQREKGLSDDEGFFAFPKCYGTYSNDATMEYAIVLDDMRHCGYRMWNKYKPIDYQHVRLAVAELGKLHAISYAMREQNPEQFDKYTKLEANIVRMMKEFPPTADFFRKGYIAALGTLHKDAEDKEEYRKMEYLKENIIDVVNRVARGSLSEPYSVFCHGDYWNNNMMFKYASEDSLVPQRVCLIDWQIRQYCSPVTDLTYYIYSSTEQKLRTDHFDDILLTYHGELAALLKRLGGDADKQFSYTALNNQLHKFALYALTLAPMLVQVVTVAPEDLPDMDKITLDNASDFDFMPKGSAAGYEVRMRDVIRDFIARGFFSDEHIIKGS